jgi:hypothetical protein
MSGKGEYRNAAVFALLSAAAFIAVAAIGCGTTQLVNVWQDPSYRQAPLQKVMVIAMRKDQVRRRMWEDALVATLNKGQDNLLAAPSYQLFPNSLPDTTQLEQDLQDQGFDGVLLISRVRRRLVTSDVPGYTTTEAKTVYKKRWNTYVTRFDSVYHEGYTDTSRVIRVRTDLLLARDGGRMVWSGTSSAVDPSSPDAFRKEVASGVVKQLRKGQLIP